MRYTIINRDFFFPLFEIISLQNLWHICSLTLKLLIHTSEKRTSIFINVEQQLRQTTQPPQRDTSICCTIMNARKIIECRGFSSIILFKGILTRGQKKLSIKVLQKLTQHQKKTFGKFTLYINPQTCFYYPVGMYATACQSCIPGLAMHILYF